MPILGAEAFDEFLEIATAKRIRLKREAWRGRLLQMAGICIDDSRAVELRDWAQTIADVYELDTEVE